MVDEEQSDWDDHLSSCEIAYNTSIHSGTQHTPYYLNHGEEMRKPIYFISDPPSQNADTNEIITELQSSLERARQHLLAAQQRQEQYANRTRRDIRYNVGDRVWLSTTNLRLPTTNSIKLQHRWCGPFRISQKIGDVNYKLKLTGQLKGSRIHPIFHVNLLRPFIEFDRFRHDPDDLPPVAAWVDDESAVYEVERIMKHRQYRGKLQYLVKWYNYDAADATWELAESLQSSAPDAVADYRTRYRLHDATASPPHAEQQSTKRQKSNRNTHDATTTTASTAPASNRRSSRRTTAARTATSLNDVTLHMLQMAISNSC